MTATASKLGKAKLWLDWSQLNLGSSAKNAPSDEAWLKLKSRFESGEVAFFDAPENDSISQSKASIDLAQTLLSRRIFKHCLFIGIGGSALGPKSLIEALAHQRSNSIHFHFLENPDSTHFDLITSSLDPAETLVVVVTKSGSTFETLAQFMWCLEWLGKNRWQQQVVAITDPKKGDLRQMVTQHQLISLEIAPGVGGRYSIFTPVGLFAASLAGLDVSSFMQGAQDIRNYVLKTEVQKNALFSVAHSLWHQSSKKSIHVCMPYSTRLQLLSQWWVQLWGESLGKDGKGFTPLAAVGAIDQHSLLQLLRDGPQDKITFFITLESAPKSIRIPKVLSQYPSFKLLGGHSFDHLLQVEYESTQKVLSRAQHPNLTLRLDSLNESCMGAAYFAFSVLTAYLGTVMELNPFDQPGVEEGKVYTREGLSQAAMDQWKESESESERAVRRLRQ